MKKSALLILFVIIFSYGFSASYKGELIARDKKLTIDFKDVELIDVIRIISRNFNINLIAGDNVKGKVTVSFSEVPVDDALEIILKVNNYTYVKDGTIIKVIPFDQAKSEYGEKVEKVQPKIEKIYKSYVIQKGDTTKIADKVKLFLKTDDRIAVDDINKKIVVYTDQDNELLIDKLINDLDAGEKIITSTETPSGTKVTVLKLKTVGADDMKEIIKEIYPGMTAEIKSGKILKTLIIKGTDKEIRAIENVIKAYDVSPLQVAIEAKVVEIVNKDDTKNDFNWKYSFTGFKANDGSFSTEGNKLPDTVNTDGSNTMNLGIIGAGQLDLLITNYLKNNNGNILSSPNISTISDNTATIRIGQKIAYATGTATTGASITLLEKDVGIKLEVTPKVNDDGTIQMKVKPELSKIEEKTVNGYPVIGTRDAETTVIVNDGETFVLGGLMETTENNLVLKIPLLGDLPIIGDLFKKETKQNYKTNLVFFITTKIIKDREITVKNIFDLNDIETKNESQPEKESSKAKLSDTFIKNKKELIKLYVEGGALEKALEEIEELKRNAVEDKELEEIYKKLKK